MSLSSAAFALAVLAAAATPTSTPNLGRTPFPDEIARADISVRPDGDTLPPGSGSVEQGRRVFEAKCQACHGPKGQDGPMDRLTGGVGSLKSKAPAVIAISLAAELLHLTEEPET